MKRIMIGTAKHVARALGYGLVGGLIVAIAVLVVTLERRPDLQVWHKADLDEEFDVRSEVEDFEDYLALEDRLFAQLDREVYDEVRPESQGRIKRYSRGSLADPNRWPRNWNRSFELATESPRGGALLIHGMSDSPYSMRSLAQSLHEEGVWVVGLRVPGHGTAPSGLLSVRWQDMAAAVRIAAQHVAARSNGGPLVLIGYSNGGALAVHYALDALEDDSLVMPAQLTLLSPEIGLTKLAALAVWQERLGHLLGLRKLAWNSILPEYDPFKYGSFSINAGKQAYLITVEIQQQITRLEKQGDALLRFPPILAFQSAADATVTASALVSGLFDRLPDHGHELVLFDVNRVVEIEPLMRQDPKHWIRSMLDVANQDFTISVLSNEGSSEDSYADSHLEKDRQAIFLHRRMSGEEAVVSQPTGLVWPRDVYSLSHVALPFPPDDPVYGGPDAKKSPGIAIGNVALRGEKGVLRIGGADMLRLRWNPFHDYLKRRMIEAVREAIAARPSQREVR